MPRELRALHTVVWCVVTTEALEDHLTAVLRFAAEEIDKATEAESNAHIHPKTLNPTGEREWTRCWPKLLKQSLKRPDNIEWLANELTKRCYFSRRSAAEQVAEHHFMRFVAAGMCRLAMELGVGVRYVRYRESDEPRAESELLLKRGKVEDPEKLLQKLRSLDGFHKTPLGQFRSGLTLNLA